MKTICITLMLVLAVALVQGQGIPTKKCPPGEHSVLYCPQMAEPSCDNPKVHDLDRPSACDIPQCFCNVPQVRNTKTGKCVNMANC
ncbi:hypothetical protein K1T71_010638 [Dendrolimus kikuchii]|uniref:Uncharacterized protein n=1 Tax=Dendrolimus kikuchii TaxID=765133 RepID=A0ACC1CPE1_9NEOP|nr:hypothetical protein K1T71_010638 [Dendrolimus kikuchii]